LSEKFDTSAWETSSYIILGRKKSEIYIKMHASLVFQGLECVDLKERNINRCMISEKEDGSLRKN